MSPLPPVFYHFHTSDLSMSTVFGDIQKHKISLVHLTGKLYFGVQEKLFFYYVKRFQLLTNYLQFTDTILGIVVFIKKK